MQTDVHTDAHEGMKKWLTPAEADLYEKAIEIKAPTAIGAFEALATTRALLKKHQYQMFHGEGKGYYCIGCGMIQGVDCTPDCAIATALKGVGGDEDDEPEKECPICGRTDNHTHNMDGVP